MKLGQVQILVGLSFDHWPQRLLQREKLGGTTHSSSKISDHQMEVGKTMKLLKPEDIVLFKKTGKQTINKEREKTGPK